MKHSHIAGVALLTSLLAGCAEDGPLQDNSKSDMYVREFIRDFGIPLPGHDFSMATSAGLEVKASQPTRIMVTADIDGEEYEFASLSVPAGTTPLPVTIPKTVSELNIYIGLDKYKVGVNETVDLDRLASSPASRGWEYNNDEHIFSGNYEANPKIAIKYNDFLDSYFTANPVGDENTMSNVADENGNKVEQIYEWFSETSPEFLFCETEFGATPDMDVDYVEYDIFPIYWSSTIFSEGNNCKNYFVKFHDCDNRQMIHFGLAPGYGKGPFPALGYSTEISSVEKVNFNDLSGFIYADDNSTEAYSTTDKTDKVIVSEGFRLKTYKSEDTGGLSLDLVINDRGNQLICSSSPVINAFHWKEKYYHTSLSNLATSRGAAKRTPLDKAILEVGVKGGKTVSSDRAYGPLRICNPDGSVEYRSAGTKPFLLGFSPAPTAPDQEVTRDYAKALFLVVPVTQFTDRNAYHVGYTRRSYTVKKYYWTIAAEDLGGTGDWDFNDAVFAFSDQIKDLNTENIFSPQTTLWGPPDAQHVRCIEVVPLAAGGTMPLYITFSGKVYDISAIDLPSEGDDVSYFYANNKLKETLTDATVLDGTWVLGTEIHKWLGQNTYKRQFNTGGKRVSISPDDKIVRLCVPTDTKPTASVSFKNGSSETNNTLMGFAVLVDKEDRLQIDTKKNGKYSFESLPDLSLGTDTYLIGAPNFDENEIAPQMLLIPTTVVSQNSSKMPNLMDVEWEWPREFINIGEAYPDFVKWITEDKTLDWTKTRETELVTRK